MAFDTSNALQGKNKNEIWNMFMDMLGDKLIKLGNYFKSMKKE